MSQNGEVALAQEEEDEGAALVDEDGKSVTLSDLPTTGEASTAVNPMFEDVEVRVRQLQSICQHKCCLVDLLVGLYSDLRQPFL